MLARFMKWMAAPLVLAAVTAAPAVAQECHTRSYDRSGYRTYGYRTYDDGYYHNNGTRVRGSVRLRLGNVVARIFTGPSYRDYRSHEWHRDHRYYDRDWRR